jgi:hypothetical protein
LRRACRHGSARPQATPLVHLLSHLQRVEVPNRSKLQTFPERRPGPEVCAPAPERRVAATLAVTSSTPLRKRLCFKLAPTRTRASVISLFFVPSEVGLKFGVATQWTTAETVWSAQKHEKHWLNRHARDSNPIDKDALVCVAYVWSRHRVSVATRLQRWRSAPMSLSCRPSMHTSKEETRNSVLTKAH